MSSGLMVTTPSPLLRNTSAIFMYQTVVQPLDGAPETRTAPRTPPSVQGAETLRRRRERLGWTHSMTRSASP